MIRDKIVCGIRDNAMRKSFGLTGTENSRSRNVWTGARPWNSRGGKRRTSPRDGKIGPMTSQCR